MMENSHKCSIPSKIVTTTTGSVSLEELRQKCEKRGFCDGKCWLPEQELVKLELKFKDDRL